MIYNEAFTIDIHIFFLPSLTVTIKVEMPTFLAMKTTSVIANSC